MAIWGDFQGITGVKRGERVVKKMENWGDVIYGWSLSYSKDRKDNPRQWDAYVCMEEPFVRINTGRAVIQRVKFDKILAAFDRAQRVLYKNMCLDCLNDKCNSPNCRRI